MYLLKHRQPDIDKIYLCVKDPFNQKYQLLIKVFFDYLQIIDDVYEKLENYNPKKKRAVLIVFDDMIADIESNKKLSPIVTKLYLWGRNSIFHLLLYKNLILKCLKLILNATHFVMKICNKIELQLVASNHSFDFDFKDFIKLYKDYTKELYSFLVNDTTLPADNPLRFRKNLL